MFVPGGGCTRSRVLRSSLLIAAPWFLLVTLRNPTFPEFFFVHEHFARFLTKVHQRVEPWWYFLPLLLAAVLPWLAPLSRAALAAWSDAGPAVAVSTAPGGGPRFRPLRFLLIYAAVILVFFSASGSKLAPYILPMVPLLAAITGACRGDPGRLARGAARAAAPLVVLVAAGLLIYSARVNSYVPHAALNWALAAVAAALAAAVMSFRTHLRPLTLVLVAALGASLAWQSLMCEYTVIPPSRSARELVRAVRPFLDAHTAAVQCRPVPGDAVALPGPDAAARRLRGRAGFGLDEEPERRMTIEQFAVRWSAGGDAVAFFDPERLGRLAAARTPRTGLGGR